MFAVSSGGVMLAVTHPKPRPNTQALDLQPSKLVLIGPHGLSPIADIGKSGDRQAGWGDLDGNEVTWMETPSTNLFQQPYEIYVSDRQGHQPVRVAEEDRPLPPPPGGTQPMIAGDRVYWAASEGDLKRPGSVRPAVYSTALSGHGKPRVEVEDVMLPSVSGQYLAYARTGFVDRALPHRRVEIHVRRLPSGEDTVVSSFQLADGQQLAALTSSGDSLAWVVSTEAKEGADSDNRGGSLLTVAEPGEEPFQVQGNGMNFREPVMSESLVAWVDANHSGQEWVLDRRTGSILELARAPGLADVSVAGDQVLWRASEGQWKTARVLP
jgi:hypothetical protein